MSKIIKIAHLSDIHIRKSPTRHKEYYNVFDNLFKSLRKQKPDRITVVGDLVHDYLDMQGEQLVLTTYFLNGLAKIAPLIITRGNHDIRKKSLKRTDSIEAVVKAIDNPRITYYNETGFFDDENVTWAIWKHGDKKNFPWKPKYVKKEGQTYIDLFHDPINGSRSASGFEFNTKRYVSVKDLKGDFSFLGDIHLKQYFGEKNTIGYPSSLVAQDFSEGDDKFHGYLLWNIEDGSVEEFNIANDYSFNSVKVNVYTDFDDLEIDIDTQTPNMKLRVIWNVLPAIRNKDNERKVIDYLKKTYSPISITHKNEFIEEDVIDVIEEIDVDNITNPEVQHEIFVEYLTKIGVEEDIITRVVELDDEITSQIEVEELTNIQWSVVKFKGTNFMSYKNIEIDWRDDDGLYQISGLNTAGKTTIMKLLTYILYNNTLETETRMKFGDKRYVNNILDVNHCEGEVVIDVNGQYFGIKRMTKLEFNKAHEIKGAPTILKYYQLETPDDDFTDDNDVDSLTEEDRVKTQKEIDKAIGTYDNFMRVVMTTSDTLNRILSNEKSVFIDSLLFDSGLDVFDIKLGVFKEFRKGVMSKPRVTCNVEHTNNQINEIKAKNEALDAEIFNLENVEINKISDKVDKGDKYVDKLTKKLYNIDEELYNLDINDVESQIDILKNNKVDVENSLNRLDNTLNKLKTSYDEKRLDDLLSKKETYRSEVFALELKNKGIERNISDQEHLITVLRGEILQHKTEGSNYKNEITKLKESKNCPTCGQEMTEEHLTHVATNINEIEKKMYNLGDVINEKTNKIPEYEGIIEKLREDIITNENSVTAMSIQMETNLTEIGELTNDKNEVERRNIIIKDISATAINIENIDLKIENLNQSIELYNKNLSQIEENKKINVGIDKAKERLGILRSEETQLNNTIHSKKTDKTFNDDTIKTLLELIDKFLEQENYDNVMAIYQKCIHRDGIPVQLLKSHAIPKINRALTDLLSEVDFNVWLDDDDLKLKLAYTNRMDSIIDAISASGKERTFASVALKFALNQINTKSKPTMLLLDEIMGKLTEDSVEEFVLILQSIKERMRKVLIVEHNHNIDFDYLIEVEKDSNGISSINVE